MDFFDILFFVLIFSFYFAIATINLWFPAVSIRRHRLGFSGYGIDKLNKTVGHFRSNKTDPQEDIEVGMLLLIDSLANADGNFKTAELNHIKQHLFSNYGELKTRRYLAILQTLTRKNIRVDNLDVCSNFSKQTDYATRTQMLDYLFSLAAADLLYSPREHDLLKSISQHLGISNQDFTSMHTRHISSRSKRNKANASSDARRSRTNTGSANSTAGNSSRRQSARSYASTSYADPYRVLGITRSATNDEVRKAYRLMAMKYHPDKVANLGEEVRKNAESQMRKINEAYERIKAARRMK